jgi:hypothetical protein
MAEDFFACLQRPEEIDGDSLQVERTHDPDALIRASCFTMSGIALEQAVEAARRAWAVDLRYGYLGAHQVSVLADRAELRCLTQIAADGFYVTALTTIRPPAHVR